MYTILASFLDFQTVSSFDDENEANHKQVLRKLMNKLPDCLKMHWVIHAEKHQSQKPI
jgi:hypothetical protein